MKQIYALLGDNPRRIMYVGCSNNAATRVKAHWKQRNSAYRSPVKDWLKSLQEPPKFYVFEEVSDDVAFKAEEYYTESVRLMGVALLNQRDGLKMRPEARKKLSDTLHSEEHQQRISNQFKGKPLSANHRSKIGKAQIGKPKSEATRNKISETLKSKKRSLG